MTRPDWLLIIITLAILPMIYERLWRTSGEAEYLVIYTPESGRQQHDLHKDRLIKVAGVLGESVVEVRNGHTRFSKAPCPGKYCMHSGWLTESGHITACLPNRVSIQLAGDMQRFDAINF